MKVLRKRALNALKWAERAYDEGDYDTALREAEYGVQLYVKALLYRVMGEEVRGHDLRELMGVLAYALLEEGLEKLYGRVAEFIRRDRRMLAEFSVAHTRATYGLVEIGEKEAKILVDTARKTIKFLKELEEEIFG